MKLEFNEMDPGNKKKLADDFLDRFWKWRLNNAPEFATYIGFHDFDDKLSDMDMSSYICRQQDLKVFLEEVSFILRSISDDIDKETLFNLQLLQDDLENLIYNFKFKPYLMPLNQLEGPQINFPELISYMKTSNIEDFEKIIRRFQLFPKQIEQIKGLMEEGIRLGILMHSVSVQPVPEQIKSLLDSPLEQCSLFKPFLNKPISMQDPVWSEIVTKAKHTLTSSVFPAYKLLSAFLKETYLPVTRKHIAVSSLPDGKELYERCLNFHTTTTLSPEEVHRLGKEEVERIRDRMEFVKNSVDFKGDLDEFKSTLRNDPTFRYTSASEIVEHYNEVCENISKVLPKLFSKFPKNPYVIKPVPDESAPNAPGAYYVGASQDGSRPGTFFINTYQAKEQCRFGSVCLSLHEADPGHHFQDSLQSESESLPSFRRFHEDMKYYEAPARFAMNTAYGEGWGLYCEYLGEELQLYDDPYEMFGRLGDEMLRACRLVVDTGMHAFSWTREEATEYMFTNLSCSRHEVETEIDRYITWPGQACGYKIGEIKIRELRRLAEKELGSSFDLKEFHNMVLLLGDVPLHVLEKMTREFIRTSKV